MINALKVVFQRSIGIGLLGKEKRRFRRVQKRGKLNTKEIEPDIQRILNDNFWDLI